MISLQAKDRLSCTLRGFVVSMFAALVNLIPIKWLLGVAGIVIVGLAIYGVYQKSVELEVQRKEMAQLRLDLAFTEKQAEVDAKIVTDAIVQEKEFRETIKTLSSKLGRAMKNEKTINFDTILSADLNNAFCLRYRNAKSTIPARGVADGEADTIARKCSGVEKRLTIGDVFEWVGLLLDHAGLEGRDKAALREWVKDTKANVNH